MTDLNDLTKLPYGLEGQKNHYKKPSEEDISNVYEGTQKSIANQQIITNSRQGVGDQINDLKKGLDDSESNKGVIFEQTITPEDFFIDKDKAISADVVLCYRNNSLYERLLKEIEKKCQITGKKIYVLKVSKDIVDSSDFYEKFSDAQRDELSQILKDIEEHGKQLYLDKTLNGWTDHKRRYEFILTDTENLKDNHKKGFEGWQITMGGIAEVAREKGFQDIAIILGQTFIEGSTCPLTDHDFYAENKIFYFDDEYKPSKEEFKDIFDSCEKPLRSYGVGSLLGLIVPLEKGQTSTNIGSKKQPYHEFYKSTTIKYFKDFEDFWKAYSVGDFSGEIDINNKITGYLVDRHFDRYLDANVGEEQIFMKNEGNDVEHNEMSINDYSVDNFKKWAENISSAKEILRG